MTQDLQQRIAVGMGACLAGQAVRFNGSSKRAPGPLRQLSDYFEFRPFCPEVGIGLGVPREPIRLVGGAEAPRAVDSATGKRDVTDELAAWARGIDLDALCGYVLVKGSPSCGMERVKRYSESGAVLGVDATGVFARAIMEANPLLPVEEDGRLNDEVLRESFVVRVFTLHAWKRLQAEGLTRKGLIDFYSRHKYLVMSHDVESYRQLGRLLAQAGKTSLETLAADTIRLIMQALARPASRGRHANALMHVQGYLKRNLVGADKAELVALIEQYRKGIIPLVVPLTLLQHHFRRHPDPYIARQVFMQPYPAALGLRSRL